VAADRVAVWDRVVRLTHWTTAVAVGVAAVVTVEALAPFGSWHEPAGWVALGSVLLRLAWGFAAPSHHARLSSFVRGPRATLAYLGAVLRGRAPRHVGHNPLGGWMAVALWATVAALALTGWLYHSDAFFGDERVESLHLALAWTIGALVVVHLVGVVFTSRHQRENLAAAMLGGRKRPPEPGDED
jgi:cytochrome b